MIFIIYFVAKYQKNERGPFETKKKQKQVSQCQKKLKWDSLVSKSTGYLVTSGFVCYARKRTTIIVQFAGPKGTIWPL